MAAWAGGIIIAALGACSPAPQSALTVYAAPGGSSAACSRAQPCSIAAAQRRVRGLVAADAGKPRDIVVQLAAGTYRLAAPLRFGPADSGSADHAVLWTSAPGARVVLSGGTRVIGWTETDRAHGIWSARVPAGTRTRQLYVDGQAAPRAAALTRSLGLDLATWNATGFFLDGATARYFADLAARLGPERFRRLELVFSPMPPTDWEASECPVDALAGNTLVMAQPCWRNLTSRPATIWGSGNNNVNPYALRPGSAPTALAGVCPLLTQPGQWCLDPATGTLRYKPRPGEDMARIDVELPRLEALLEVTGTLAHPVHDLVFRGLTFTTTTWTQPSTATGFVQVQANLHITGTANQGECTFTTPAGSCPWGGFAQPPGAVSLVAAQRIALRDDVFVDLGAVGVEVRYGSVANVIEGSLFTQIASSAVWLGCSGDPDPLDHAADPVASIIALCAGDSASAREDRALAGSAREIMTRNTLDNNLIHHVGYGYLGAAAITLMFTRHTTVAHNDVFDVPYDALTSGAWQGHPDNVATAPTHGDDVTANINADNAIIDNVFHATMQAYPGDGGAIYTDGHQGRTLHRPDGSIDAAASWAHGLRIIGNLLNAAPPGNTAYAIAPDVGSQWIDATGNVEWGFKYAFSCHWPTEATSRLRFTGNWHADPDDTHCATDAHNTVLPARPGPADVPLEVLAHAGIEAPWRSLEGTLPARTDYHGTSPASAGVPARVLITGSGFTPTMAVHVGGVASPRVDCISPNVLVAVVPPGAGADAAVTVRHDDAGR